MPTFLAAYGAMSDAALLKELWPRPTRTDRAFGSLERAMRQGLERGAQRGLQNHGTGFDSLPGRR
jgi:hypothetical protein